MTVTQPGLAAFQRGLAAQRAGRVDAAIADYRAALGEDPGLAAAHFNLGQLLRQQGDLPNAAHAFDAAVRLRPTAGDAWINLGLCREGLGDLDTAFRCYQEAARLDPSLIAATFNAGNVLRKQGDLAGARDAFERGLERAPNVPELWLNLGNVLRELGELEAATDALTRADELKRTWPEARYNLALTLLSRGRLEEGWREYEHRWARIGLAADRGLPWPRWAGEAVLDKRILVWREQGLGDELLFATCIPDLIALGAHVTLAVDHRLVGLLARAHPEITVVADGDWGTGPFDFQVSLGGLAAQLRRSRGDFRPSWSVLIPLRAQIVAWQDRLRSLGEGLKVGICWRSGLRGGERSRYYADLAAWRPLFDVPGVSFINLQYDDCDDELLGLEAATGVKIHRWPTIDLKNDLESVAALMWHLDLVITAPTAVSSLAGALGIDTWQLDPGTDWTAFGEPRSPWQPAIQLFRRPPGIRDWSSTIQSVTAELRDRVGVAAPEYSLEGK